MLAEQDIERIGAFRRLSFEPPEGYKPILTIEIPIDVVIPDDFKKSRYIWIHYKGKPEIIDKYTKIDVDDKLLEILSKPFTPKSKNWAKLKFDPAGLDCSQRMLISYSDKLLDTLLNELDSFKKKKMAKKFIIELAKLHDGSEHFKTLIDPKTKTSDAIFGSFYPKACLSLPVCIYWHEVWAILHELKILKRWDELDEETSKYVRRKIREMREGKPPYDWIYEILRFFQSKGLTLNDMIEVLELPIQTDVYPDAWLCFVLLDLANGADPSRIPYESSLYDAHKEVISEKIDYDSSVEKVKEIKKDLINNDVGRIINSIHEVVVINEDTIERTWLCLKPKLDIAKVVLKMIIYHQEIFKKHAKNLIPTTTHPTRYLQLMYQKEGLTIEKLFERCMNAQIPPKTLYELFAPKYSQEVHVLIWCIAASKTYDRLGFTDSDDFAKWLGFRDWNDYERWIRRISKPPRMP